MKTRYSFTLAALAMTLAFAMPAQAQDVMKEEGAASAEMMESHNEMMGAGCECSCMEEMHGKMMEMHGDAEGHAEGMAHDADEGHAEGEAHAEGMDSDEGHAEMMAAHQEMMAGCKCMSGEKGEGEHAMSCKMHGEGGAMGEMGEGMQHRHGMESDKDSESETEEVG
ncbi:MAG: hypothetical protein KJO06_10215 [Gemmatimonadetes bacterium]|nr:hypothetical protein [Gemmatimonadota bacterium]